MANQNVEEKSLSTSIEFTYQKSPGFFSFIKKMQIDLISIISLFLIICVAGYAYVYRTTESTKLKKVQNQVVEYQTSYESIKKEVETIKDIKTVAFDWSKFLKIFDFLTKTGFEKYDLKPDKRTNAYSIQVDDFDADKLAQIIEEWIKQGIINTDTKKSYMISKPGFASAWIIFR